MSNVSIDSCQREQMTPAPVLPPPHPTIQRDGYIIGLQNDGGGDDRTRAHGLQEM